VKNFDTQRSERNRSVEERTFQLGGETFVCRAGIKPEVLVPYEDLDGSQTASETLAVIDQMIVDCLETHDDAPARYRALRDRQDDPITLDDLTEVAKWMIETAVGRPTQQPVESSPSRDPNVTISTGASSLPALAAA